MARPKGYDRAEALDAVRAAFWEFGYDGLSISEIENKTGLNRFAIRTDFGGKEALFLEALAGYITDTETYVTGPICEAADIKTIVSVLEGLVVPSEGSSRRFGCLMVNTTVENATNGSPSLKEQTDTHWRTLGNAFRCALEAERKRGNLRDDVVIPDAVQFLVGAIIAATVINRDAGQVDAAAGLMRTYTATVKSWSVTPLA